MLNSKSYNRGAAIVVEIDFKRYIPFADSIAFDPSVYTIDIFDPDEQKVVSAAALTRADTGQYYYICQSEDDWVVGYYRAEISSAYAGYTDKAKLDNIFLLTE